MKEGYVLLRFVVGLNLVIPQVLLVLVSDFSPRNKNFLKEDCVLAKFIIDFRQVWVGNV